MTSKPKKVVIVGGVAGGATAAARVRRLSEECEIIMLEKGPHVSFSNCSLPYHLSGLIKDHEDLVMMKPDDFYNQYRIDARIYNEVTEIDRQNKRVKVKNVVTGEEYYETYDKLVLSPGATPIVPPFEGLDKVNYFTIRNVVDVAKLNSFLKDNASKDVVVIGGGFIGVEVCENLKLGGYDVTLIEATPQIMNVFDYDMAQILHKEMIDNHVNLIVNDKVMKFEKDEVLLESNKRIHADAVVIAIGVAPDTRLAEKAGLKIGDTRAIEVNHNYQTSDPDIYAVGDAIEAYNTLTNKRARLALAGPALRQARSAADHMFGKSADNMGVIGSSAIKLFDLNAAVTGLTENSIKSNNLGITYDSIMIIPNDKVGLMPDVNPMHFKLIFEVPTGRILGAQAIGKGNVDKRVDIIATLIRFNGTLYDLKEMELCYAPPFSTARDVVNIAALVGINILENNYRQVHVSEVRNLVESGAYIIDVREKEEYEEGHIVNAVNIPLSEIRNRTNEIPTDRPVYLHCRSSQRSYNALTALQHLGFKNLYNISGSFMGICFYEYFNDVTTNRKPIVTKYNFK
ncbi:MAG TPA: FAD-dependent oxidoreductase [Soehngenia sp.]|nr:FAD-dependent oxidoreductase [Soehngenia sp.]